MTDSSKNAMLQTILGTHAALGDKDAELMRTWAYKVLHSAVTKSLVVQTWKKNQELIDVYRLLQQNYDEQFSRPTRFPTAFGLSRRLYSEFLQSPPKVEVESTTRNKNDLASAQAIAHAVDHAKDVSNYYQQRAKLLLDFTGAFGNGVMHIGTKDDAKGRHTLAFRRVDPRFFFFDEAAIQLHDRTDGNMGARWCYEDALVPLTTFRKKYMGRAGFRNISLVHGVDKIVPQLGLLSVVFDSESFINSLTAGEWVQMGRIVDVENQKFILLANGLPIYDCDLKEEYAHGRIPYAHYKYYDRNDIAWADGPIDVAYAIIIENDLLNTMEMDSIKYSVAPPTFIAGNMSLDEEEQLIRPGALVRVNGVNGGKVSDSIYQMQMDAGDKAFYNARNMLYDELTIATGDDMRGLFSNPDQLATQTAYKQKTLAKLLKATVTRNELQAVKDETELIIETMKHCYGDGDQMIVPVKGYKVRQSSRGKKRLPKFEKSPKTNDSFSLYPNLFDIDYNVVTKPSTVKEDEDQQAIQNTISFLQNLLPLSQLLPDLPQKVDFYSFIYDLADRLGVDMENVFPTTTVNSGEDGEDMAMKIMQGNYPDQNTNPSETFQELLQIRQSPAYAQMSMQQKQQLDSKLKELAAFRGKMNEQNQQQPMTLTPNVNLKAPMPTPTTGPQGASVGPNGLANSNTAKTI